MSTASAAGFQSTKRAPKRITQGVKARVAKAKKASEEASKVAAAAKKPPKRKSKLKTTQELLSYSQRYQEEVQSKGRFCMTLRSAFIDLKRQAMAAKKEWEDAQLELQRLVVNGPERMPLYDGVADLTPGAKDAKQEAPQQQAQGEKFDKDGWRKVSLKDAGVPSNLLEKLEANSPPLRTLGELVDWQAARGGHNRLTDIKGIGESGEAKIADNIAEFWKKHPEYTREAEKPAKSKA